MRILDATCHFTIANNRGEIIFDENPTNNGEYWDVFIPSSNTSKLGVYNFGVDCNNTHYGGVLNGYFEVTPTGEGVSEAKAIFYVGILFLLMFFLTITIFLFVTFDNLLNRIGMLGLSYLLLIAITFIGWNMAQDFLITAPIVINLLRLSFLILMIGAFPLLVGAFAWYFILLFRIKKIENLMKRGFSYDEAERLSRRKRR